MSDLNKHIAHFNVYDLSKRWKLAPKTLDRWRQQGTGPCFLKFGGRVIYRKEDIEAYEKENVRKATEKHEGDIL